MPCDPCCLPTEAPTTQWDFYQSVVGDLVGLNEVRFDLLKGVLDPDGDVAFASLQNALVADPDDVTERDLCNIMHFVNSQFSPPLSKIAGNLGDCFDPCMLPYDFTPCC